MKRSSRDAAWLTRAFPTSLEEGVSLGYERRAVRNRHAIDGASVPPHVELSLASVAARDLDVRVHCSVGVARRRIAPDVPGVRVRGALVANRGC